MNQRKMLPLGIQTLAKIRSRDFYYVDKTALALKLIADGTHYFLSRPRRFGKSLFLDTLKELFAGNRVLFKGLAAESQWDWSQQYPIISFSFGSGHFRDTAYLPQNMAAQLEKLETQFGIEARYSTAPERFQDLVLAAKKQTGHNVVILIDEYDKPILDALTEPEAARVNRDFLRGFYGVIKDYDAHVHFSFLTGVSKFSKVSLFSGLNNLTDITLDPAYSALCGYTDHDVDTVFAPELAGLDREEIRRWYNGYYWLGDSVYNPFDILQLFNRREFSNYRFETGTPAFLLDLLVKRQVPTLKLGDMLTSSSVLSSFDVDQIATEALLFQTGYLTITQTQRAGGQTFYTLGYPNQEVYQSLNESLLTILVANRSSQSQHTLALYKLLLANDFDGLKALFQRFFASIPYSVSLVYQ